MLSVIYRVLSNFLRGLGYLAVVYIGAQQVLSGQGGGGLGGSAISLGLFQGAVLAFSRISASSHRLTVLWASLQDVGVGLARVFEILRKQSEHALAVPPVDRGRELPPAVCRALVFDRVNFGYVPGVAVLGGIDLEARVGELTAVVGPSGGGKSTLIALLLRFFDPAVGRILLDGRDIHEFDLAAWRGMIAVVQQDNPLLTGTLRENIAYGRPGASTEEIRAAAGRAGLREFVDSLPAGLDTVLGESGAKLSSGQAQRIGVARALLRDAPILLLDEPSSALDIVSEERLMRGCELGWPSGPTNAWQS
jgi:ABC-type multidrug transport system fused ATPase/permease subunit